MSGGDRVNDRPPISTDDLTDLIFSPEKLKGVVTVEPKGRNLILKSLMELQKRRAEQSQPSLPSPSWSFDMEAAPKDGSYILGWGPEDGIECIRFQGSPEFAHLLGSGWVPRWTSDHADAMNGERGDWTDGKVYQPKAWMPLPEPPATPVSNRETCEVCGGDSERCRSIWKDQRKCCPDCTCAKNREDAKS